MSRWVIFVPEGRRETRTGVHGEGNPRPCNPRSQHRISLVLDAAGKVLWRRNHFDEIKPSFALLLSLAPRPLRTDPFLSVWSRDQIPPGVVFGCLLLQHALTSPAAPCPNISIAFRDHQSTQTNMVFPGGHKDLEKGGIRGAHFRVGDKWRITSGKIKD
ncbi:hypothetical protein E2C01_053673 [Portunus trituberculatus]|uniref:Uncharacterized protein n=1 Tax=Portunus trituberculatus TaxID=210409 RepID=A0A5B7GPV6_PORTR|nr:hypothetical protein [Portunus trituberculatus]